jgi:hypothetical protein
MRALRKWLDRYQITRYTECCTVAPDKNAIVSFLSFPLLLPKRFRDQVRFSNRGAAQAIPEVLNGLGYSVQVVNFNHPSVRVAMDSSLFIGHAGINFVQIARQLRPDAVKIYYATGIEWREFNVRVASRIYSAACRRGFVLRGTRAIHDDEEGALHVADGVIVLGNQYAADTYRGTIPVDHK